MMANIASSLYRHAAVHRDLFILSSQISIDCAFELLVNLPLDDLPSMRSNTNVVLGSSSTPENDEANQALSYVGQTCGVLGSRLVLSFSVRALSIKLYAPADPLHQQYPLMSDYDIP